MPTYQYACTDCGEQLEVVQSFTADPLTECPACGGRLRKVFHPVGVVFKGSGFYRTDSRGSGTKAGAGSTTASKDSAPSSGSASSPATGGSGSSGTSTSTSGSSSGGSSSAGSSSTSGGGGSSPTS